MPLPIVIAAIGGAVGVIYLQGKADQNSLPFSIVTGLAVVGTGAWALSHVLTAYNKLRL